MDDVMNCYEFTEHILQEIYAPKGEEAPRTCEKRQQEKGAVK